MTVTLQEAIDILELELGCDRFVNTGTTIGSGTFSTIGLSTNLVGTGVGDLTLLLQPGDYLVLSQVAYIITEVTSTTLEINEPIDATNAEWEYVLINDVPKYLEEQKKRLKSLHVSNRIITSVTAEDSSNNKLLAIAMFACMLFNGYDMDGIDSRITSEKIGDLSVSYDTSQLSEPIPSRIISILGDLYIGGLQPGFFQK